MTIAIWQLLLVCWCHTFLCLSIYENNHFRPILCPNFFIFSNFKNFKDRIIININLTKAYTYFLQSNRASSPQHPSPPTKWHGPNLWDHKRSAHKCPCDRTRAFRHSSPPTTVLDSSIAWLCRSRSRLHASNRPPLNSVQTSSHQVWLDTSRQVYKRVWADRIVTCCSRALHTAHTVVCLCPSKMAICLRKRCHPLRIY